MAKKLPSHLKSIREQSLPEIDKETQKTLSYSQTVQYNTCPHQWYLSYVEKLQQYKPSIHTAFGTAFHETIQTWLTVMYDETVAKANNMDLHMLLLENMKKVYAEEREKQNGEHFSTPEQLKEFYEDGVEILNYIKRKRAAFFGTKTIYLVGVEIPLLYNLTANIYFKGFIDLVLYDESTNKYTIIDIKTSTSGWNEYAKKDDKKLAQLLLYKEFFSKQFNVNVDDIDVQYFIVKRKVPADPDYPAMGRRVQEFSPPSGKIKRGQALKALEAFIKDAFDEEGRYVQKEYDKVPSKNNCRFCEYRNTEHCSAGVM